MFYCEKSCQTKDWLKFHKHQECKLFAAHCDSLEDLSKTTFRLLLRLLLLVKYDPSVEAKQFEGIGGVKRSLSDPPPFKNHFMKMTNFMSEFKQFTSSFRKMGLTFDLDKALHYHCLLCTQVNGTSMASSLSTECWTSFPNSVTSGSVFMCLCVPLTDFSHSCVPNAVKVFKGQFCEIRAIKKIKPDEPVTFDFLNERPCRRNIRKKMLMDRFGYDCSCSRCKDSGFDKTIQWKWLRNKEKRIATLTNQRKFPEAARAILKLLPSYEQVLGRYHPLVCGYVMRLALMANEEIEVSRIMKMKPNGNPLNALTIITKLNECLRITFGLDHPYFTSDLELKFRQILNLLGVSVAEDYRDYMCLWCTPTTTCPHGMLVADRNG